MAPISTAGPSTYPPLMPDEWLGRATGLTDPGAPPLPGPFSSLTSSIAALGDLFTEIERFDDFDEFLDRVAATAVGMLGYDSAMLIATDESGHAKASGSCGLSMDYLRGTRGSKGPGFDGWSPVREALATGLPSLVANVEAEPRLHYFRQFLRHQGVRACGSFPLRHSQGSVGVLTVYLREPHEFTQLEADRISAVTSLAASIVDSAVSRRERVLKLAEQQALVLQHERSAAIGQRLIQAVLSRQGLEGVAATLGEMVGGAVVVTDPGGRILASYERGEDGHRSTAAGDHAPNPVDPAGWRLRKQVVMINGIEVGSVSARTSPLTDERLFVQAINHGAVAAALQMLGDRGQQPEPEEAVVDLLADIRRLRSTDDPHDLLARSDSLGFHLRDGFHLVVVGSADRMPAPSSKGLLKRARLRLSSLVQGALVAPCPGGIVVMLPSVAGADLDVLAVADMLADAACDLPLPVPMHAVVAGKCSGLGQVAEYLLFSESLLRLARADREVGRTAAPVIDGRALTLHRILSMMPDPVGLIEFRDQVIGPLLDYDRLHRTDLLATAECYLAHGLRAKETARELIVHVNSLSYRLKRIEEILGFELRGGTGMLHLQFAIELDRVLRGRAVSVPVLTDSA